MSDSVFTRMRMGETGSTVVRLWHAAGGLRGLMVGSLPLLLEAVSPQRVALSVVVALLYLAVAVVIARPRRIDVPVLVYAGVALAFMAVSIYVSQAIDPLNAAQRSFGIGKAGYFLAAILPLSVGAALLISKLDDLKPAVVVFIVIGVATAAIAVPLRDSALFGESRYTVEGNVMASAGLLLSQFWILRNLRLGALLILLCLAGVLISESRQSVSAFVIGLAATGVYWLTADRLRARAGRPGRLTGQWLLPVVVFAAVFAVAAVWALLAVQPWIHLPVGIRDPVRCNCIAGRFVGLVTNPGGRDVLIQQSWTLFLAHPIFGAGLGSFVGLVGGYPYPHNVELEVASELGLIGVALLLVPLAVGWVRLAVTGIKLASAPAACALVLVLIYTVVANLSGDISSQRGLWVFGLMVLKLGWRANPELAPP